MVRALGLRLNGEGLDFRVLCLFVVESLLCVTCSFGDAEVL